MEHQAGQEGQEKVSDSVALRHPPLLPYVSCYFTFELHILNAKFSSMFPQQCARSMAGCKRE